MDFTNKCLGNKYSRLMLELRKQVGGGGGGGGEGRAGGLSLLAMPSKLGKKTHKHYMILECLIQ